MKGIRIGTDAPGDFISDLQEANECENRLKSIFEQNYNCTVSTSQGLGSFPAWDLSVTLLDQNKTFTIECKQDKLVWKTGNICVEYSRTMKDGTIKPTCISTTKADVYAYYFNSTYYLIPTDDLRQMIRNKLYTRIVTNAGDGDRASCYLFPKEVFLKYAENIKTIIKQRNGN